MILPLDRSINRTTTTSIDEDGNNQSKRDETTRTLPLPAANVSKPISPVLVEWTNQTFLRHTPMILDLLPWEQQSMRGVERTLPLCQPPQGIPNACCLGTTGRLGKVRHEACFRNGRPDPFQRVEQAARRELEQTTFPLYDNNNNEHSSDYYHRDCDICRVVELLYQQHLTLLLMGDSVMYQTYSGFLCELARRGYHVVDNTTYITKRSRALGVRSISTLEITGPDHWKNNSNNNNNNNTFVRITYVSLFKPTPDMSEISEMAQTYDIIMMNFGLHWNWPDRDEYRATVKAVFNATRGGNVQLLLYRETTAQHFNATAGEWLMGKEGVCVPLLVPSTNSSSDRYQWREHAVHSAAVQAGYKVVVATNVSLLPQPMMEENYELVILPFYSFTAQLFDLHPHECTHFCSTPFLWLPLWRSLRLAMDRRWNSVKAKSVRTQLSL